MIQNIYQIESLIIVKAYQTPKDFVFILQVPIIGTKPYQYYYLTALPIYINNKTFKQIIPIYQYVGIRDQNYIYSNNLC